MKFLKVGAIVLVTLFSIPFVVAFFSQKEYSVKREIVINQPKKIVFDYVKYVKNQENYSSWANMDTDMIKTYKGEDAKVGFVYRWESKNKDVGIGEQEITKIVEGKRIDFDLRFYEPFKANDKGYLQIESLSDNSTKIIWGYDAKMSYPFNLLIYFIDFEQIVGQQFQFGLENLKEILEKK